MTALLDIGNLSSGYGQIAVLSGVSLEIGQGEIVSVVGANGAGKSTLLLTISGHLKPREGRIVFDGHDLGGVAAHDTVARGLAMVPEGGRLFPFMTVQDNLELGAYRNKGRTLRSRLEDAFEMFPVLAARRSQLAGGLSGGERQMCAIARAMMSQPRLLMLDEPSLGLAPIMVERMFDLILSLVKTRNLTVLLVEQNVGEALSMSQRAYILDRGTIIKTGPGPALLGDEDVRKAYLGI